MSNVEMSKTRMLEGKYLRKTNLLSTPLFFPLLIITYTVFLILENKPLSKALDRATQHDTVRVNHLVYAYSSGPRYYKEEGARGVGG